MLLDTSVIIEILTQERGEHFSDDILGMTKDEKLYMSIVQMGELTDWCIRKEEDISLTINAVKQLVHIVPLNDIICIKASMMKDEMHQKGVETFGIMDGIVLCSAMFMKQKLLTLDNDFRIAESAVVV